MNYPVKAVNSRSEVVALELRAQLAQARKSIEEGVSLSAALTAAGLASPVATHMYMPIFELAGAIQ